MYGIERYAGLNNNACMNNIKYFVNIIINLTIICILNLLNAIVCFESIANINEFVKLFLNPLEDLINSYKMLS